ncbi:MAG: ribosome silencing factor [Bacteriovoracia bacterium]
MRKLTSHDLVLKCTRAAIDKKAVHNLIFEVGKLGAFTDYFLITSGTNEKQVQAICDEICRVTKEAGAPRTSVEGYDEGRWVLVDFGDVVVHIFHEYIREFYDLETLWSDAPRLPIPKDYYTSGPTSGASSGSASGPSTNIV